MNNLPSNWSWVKLGDVCEFSQGIQVGIKKQLDKKLPNFVRFLRIIDFTQGNQEERYIASPGEKYVVNTEDLSMVRYGASTGFICRGLKGAIANNLFRIIPINSLSKTYLFYFFRAPIFQSNLESSLKGAAMPAISFTFIKSLLFPLPQLPEQKKIVEKIDELFSGLDSGVASLKKAKEQIRLYRQSVLSAAFSGRLTQGAIGEKQAVNLKAAEQKTAYLNQLPNGWKWVKVSDVGDIVTGTTPSKKVPEYYGKDFPLYKPTDLNAGINTRNASDNISKLGATKARLLPEKSTMVTCIGATIGKTGMNKILGTTNQQINSIIPNKNYVPEFVYYFCIFRILSGSD